MRPATLHTTPADGATHWSGRSVAAETGISKSSVARYFQPVGLQPHCTEGFKLSNDAFFIVKLSDVLGLKLSPRDNALVLRGREGSMPCAGAHTTHAAHVLRGRRGRPHDDTRHGTITLFAALNVLNGAVLDTCKPRHRHQKYLSFLQEIERAVPADLDIHRIADHYATHNQPKVKAWLAAHPRWTMHFIPTYSSWLNQVEPFFGLITDKAIRRGSFISVKQRVHRIGHFVAAYSANSQPFKWTATADSITEKRHRLFSPITGTGY